MMRRFFTNLSGPQRLGAVALLFLGLSVQSSCALLSPSNEKDATSESLLASPLDMTSPHATPTAPSVAAAQNASPLLRPRDEGAELEQTVQALINMMASSLPQTEQVIYFAIAIRDSQTTSYLPLVAKAHPTPAPAPTGPPPPTPTPLPTPDAIARSVKVPILMYHYLSVPPAGSDFIRRDLSVAPDLFARQLDSMLEAGYQTISLYDLTMHLARGNTLPIKPVIVTFDDGYRDNYENAFPLLAERDMTATFFIAPDFIDRQRSGYMDWGMVRTMSVGRMSIEAHGLDHQSLSGRDVPFLAWQSLATIQAIERETGKRPRFVSYPAGQYDALTIEVFRNSHFWAGLTTAQGATHQSEDMFELRRVRVRNTTKPAELIRLMELDW